MHIYKWIGLTDQKDLKQEQIWKITENEEEYQTLLFIHSLENNLTEINVLGGKIKVKPATSQNEQTEKIQKIQEKNQKQEKIEKNEKREKSKLFSSNNSRKR